MKTLIIVQARMNSERLPGKVLKKVLGKPLLKYEIERLKRVRSAGGVLVATGDDGSNDAIADFCRAEKVTFFRGPEEDVLSRFYGAAKEHSAETIVRVCADSPLVDPAVTEKTLRHFQKNPGRFDYVSNVLRRTYPRGLDCEVFSFKALEEAHREAREKSEREHVTPFIYNHPERYRLGGVENDTDESRYRWTVDTAEDFELIRAILTELYPLKPDFEMADVLKLYAKHPEWRKINEHVRQKAV